MSRLGAVLAGLLLSAGFYMLMIDTVDLPELFAAVVAALLATGTYEAARVQGLAEARISWRWVARAWRVVASVPVQIGLVAWEAIAQLVRRQPSRGRFRAVPFAAGTGDSSDFGRRALAEGLGSLAPNSIVIGVDSDRNLLLVHQLRRTGGRRQLDVLDLG